LLDTQLDTVRRVTTTMGKGKPPFFVLFLREIAIT
jgi:hypothetical protein